MLALFYLIIIFTLGYHLLAIALPWLCDLPHRQSLANTPIPVPKWMIRLPSAWLIGALVMNWTTFILSDFTRSMHIGSWTALTAGVFFTTICLWANSRQRKIGQITHYSLRYFFSIEILYVFLCILIASFIAWHTLTIQNDTILIGYSVWSDFGPHLAMIRSFSVGDNFPPQYPHFPDGSIRYHFMFQFLAASLESLGMPLDWAFNLPSILSLVSLFLLLYVLAVAITGERWVGILTGFLFIFRSSFAFFTFIKDNLANDTIWQLIWNVSLHIGNTEHENWGLWAQNVYANQRHFAFSISVFILILLSILPLLQSMTTACQSAANKSQNLLRTLFLGKINWWPQNWQRAITLGLLLGAISFWNGAVVITGLIILGILTVFCRHRGEFLIIALLTIALSLIQQHWFIGNGAAAVQPHWYIGFLAEHKTPLGITTFYIELLGLFFPLFFISVFNTPRGYKALALAFIAPVILASLVSLTIDINANHKFIMLGIMLSNIFIAAFIVRIFKSKDNALRILAACFSVMLTITGWVDLLTLFNMNKNNVTFNLNDPLTKWVKDNTKPKDVFLTDWSTLNAIQLGGRPIYFGWPYYAWSAGYDTDKRTEIWKRIYSTSDSNELLKTVHDAGINFILIDDAVRDSQEFKVNEKLINQTFTTVFSDEKNHSLIFKVD